MRQLNKASQDIFSLLETGDEACDFIIKRLEQKNDAMVPELIGSLESMLAEVLRFSDSMKQKDVLLTNVILNMQDYLAAVRGHLEKKEWERALLDFKYPFYGLYNRLYEELYTAAMANEGPEYQRELFRESAEALDGIRKDPLSIRTGNAYKYKASIVVMVYDSMEYTKQCIESIYRYTPGLGTDYELIIRSDGSTDGVNEYLKTLPNEKTFLYRHNVRLGDELVYSVEGKYTVFVSNDVVVTENWLENLLKCLESDPSVGMVVPATNRLSNLETIPVSYTDVRGMQQFAKSHNVSDPRKWEERERLINFVFGMPTDLLLHIGLDDTQMAYGYFTDDDLSLRIRRAGFRLINAKDTFVHHYGSASYSKIGADKMALMEDYMVKKHGFTTWGPNLVSGYISCFFRVPSSGGVFRLLSVDDGIAAVSLSVKNALTAKRIPVRLYGFLHDPVFAPYVESTYEEVRRYPDDLRLDGCFPEKMDAAVVPSLAALGENYLEALRALRECLNPGAPIYFMFDNPAFAGNLMAGLQGTNVSNPWASPGNVPSRVVYFNPERLSQELAQAGFSICSVNRVEDPQQNVLAQKLLGLFDADLRETVKSRLSIKKYVFVVS